MDTLKIAHVKRWDEQLPFITPLNQKKCPKISRVIVEPVNNWFSITIRTNSLHEIQLRSHKYAGLGGVFVCVESRKKTEKAHLRRLSNENSWISAPFESIGFTREKKNQFFSAPNYSERSAHNMLFWRILITISHSHTNIAGTTLISVLIRNMPKCMHKLSIFHSNETKHQQTSKIKMTKFVLHFSPLIHDSLQFVCCAAPYLALSWNFTYRKRNIYMYYNLFWLDTYNWIFIIHRGFELQPNLVAC